ncbi:MAG: hypothetical protein K2Z81_28105, partial [Cyanobacteria bacterium]|nr:hypothetical protein [Cyanobacteriota bacterium]
VSGAQGEVIDDESGAYSEFQKQAFKTPRRPTNPKFSKMDDQELAKYISETKDEPGRLNDARLAAEEWVARQDRVFTSEDRERAIGAIKILQEALRTGRDITYTSDNNPVLSDRPLQPERRQLFHQAIMSDLLQMHGQITSRAELAKLQQTTGFFKDAEQSLVEATRKADAMPIDLIRKENSLLGLDVLTEVNPKNRSEMMKTQLRLSGDYSQEGILSSPIYTRQMLVGFYLGTSVVRDPVSRREHVKFGSTGVFKPVEAFDTARVAQQRTKEILGFDPLDPNETKKHPGVTSIFGALATVFEKPEKYNMYEMVDKFQVDKIKEQIEAHPDWKSFAVDLGVVALAAGIIVATKGRQFQEAELILGRHATAGRMNLLKEGMAFSAAITVTPLARNIGYQLVTGKQEDLNDSLMHALGSVAAVESGRGVYHAFGGARTQGFEKAYPLAFGTSAGYTVYSGIAGVHDIEGRGKNLINPNTGHKYETTETVQEAFFHQNRERYRNLLEQVTDPIKNKPK